MKIARFDYAGPKFSASGKIATYNSGDSISSLTGIWTPVGEDVKKDPYYYKISGIYGSLLDANDDQNFKNKYIGIRFVEEQDTLYGWLRISLVNAHLIFHDCAYQRKY